MSAHKTPSNGTGYVQFRYTDWKGERKNKLKRGFATKKEALAWERQFLMQTHADLNMTLASFCELYEQDIKPKLKLNTWLTKESIIQQKILPYLGKRKVSEITPRDIITWQNEIRKLTDSKGNPYSTTYLKTIKNTTIIPETSEKFNGEYDFPGTFPNITDPRFLPAISMVELYNTVYQTNPPIIDGLLYPGCYLFVGAPKEGKSFLMLQLGYHVSTGLPFWGYPVRQGTVLYLALEDAFPRLQSRLYRMFQDEATESLYLSTWSKRIGEGLEEQITAFAETHPDTKLVIIDTLKRVRSTIINRQAYDEDYDFVSAITDLSRQLGICIMIVHHTRKVKSEKKFDNISGTNGLLGAADGAFLLEKDSDRSKTAELSVTGRDQPDMVMKLDKDTNTLQWMLISAEADLWEEPPDPVLEAVSNILSAEASQWSGTATDLVSLLGLDMKPNQLSVRLNVNAQRLLNDYNIHYTNSRSHAGRRISLQLISLEA